MEKELTKKEYQLIHKLAARASNLAAKFDVEYDLLTASMDIEAAHKDCGLKLQELLDADSSNFGHDVFGIRRHMDRTTGKIGDCFLPRYNSQKAMEIK